ncbi:hypothetical protein MTO96_010014 [Rhipicephalus appendiculatus]
MIMPPPAERPPQRVWRNRSPHVAMLLSRTRRPLLGMRNATTADYARQGKNRKQRTDRQSKRSERKLRRRPSMARRRGGKRQPRACACQRPHGARTGLPPPARAGSKRPV